MTDIGGARLHHLLEHRRKGEVAGSSAGGGDSSGIDQTYLLRPSDEAVVWSQRVDRRARTFGGLAGDALQHPPLVRRELAHEFGDVEGLGAPDVGAVQDVLTQCDRALSTQDADSLKR